MVELPTVLSAIPAKNMLLSEIVLTGRSSGVPAAGPNPPFVIDFNLDNMYCFRLERNG